MLVGLVLSWCVVFSELIMLMLFSVCRLLFMLIMCMWWLLIMVWLLIVMLSLLMLVWLMIIVFGLVSCVCSVGGRVCENIRLLVCGLMLEMNIDLLLVLCVLC